MKKQVLATLAIVLLWGVATSQVGINTTSPADGSILDIDSDDKGILIPRVNISNLNNIAPITGGSTEGLLVYNTNTTIGTGYFYWNGSNWVAVGSERGWGLTGNAGTNATNNFVGTTDDEPLVFKTDNNERMRIDENGYTIVNGVSPEFSGDIFTTYGDVGDSAINGLVAGSGIGIYGENASNVGYGVWGNSSNVAVYGTGAYGGYFISNHQDAFGVTAINSTDTGNGIAFRSFGQNLSLSFPHQTSSLMYGTANGLVSFSSNIADGTGIRGVGNGGTSAISLTAGVGIAGTGNKYGVFGYSTETGINNPNDGTFSSAGGYFANGYNGWSAVAGWWDPSGGGNNDQVFKIIGTGSVSTIVKDTNERSVVMFAPEAPEVLFQDYGIGQLVSGSAKIELDPILVKNIRVDDEHPLKVFIQLEGDCNGVYVTNKSANSFEVRELQNGTSNVQFSWSIVATRANETFISKDGNIRVSNYGNRFPIAPKLPELNLQNARIINNDNLSKIESTIKTKKE